MDEWKAQVQVGRTVSVPKLWSDDQLDVVASAVLDPERAGRAYDHWRYAERLEARSGASPLDRGVVVTKLWNAVDHRLRLLQTEYDLRSRARALGFGRRRGVIEVLAELGVVRPLFIGELKSLRNQIEHVDDEPPSRARCRELIDVVWYFLRSTDGLARARPEDLESDRLREPGCCWVWLTFDEVGTGIGLRASLCDRCRAGWDGVDAHPIVLDGRTRVDDDSVIVSGRVDLPGPALLPLFRAYFAARP